MRIKDYLMDKLLFIITLGISILVVELFLLLYGVSIIQSIISVIIFCIPLLIYFTVDYYNRKSYYNELLQNLNELEDKYLISEVMQEKANFYDGKLIEIILKVLSKSMHENVKKYKKQQSDYKEYIETWVHEVKTPIASSKLIIDNHENSITLSLRDEVDIIDGLIEQALYYARSENVEKDFIVKEFEINKLVKGVIANNSKYFIQNKIVLKIDKFKYIVFSDTKWCEFIMNQIFSNSIKYSKKDNKEIRIYAIEGENNVKLVIEDNGIGISKEELSMVCNKGFTGISGRNQTSATGMGMYLCKKLCNKLSLGLKIESELGIGTKVIITFPKNKLTIM